ncbi:MAG: hypothetical protein WBG91_02705 [Syntrophobacteria bacterium]
MIEDEKTVIMEGKRFPVGKVRLAWMLTPRLIITLFIVQWGNGFVLIFSDDVILLVSVFLIFSFILLAIWIPFLRMPYVVIVDEKQITFKAFIRTVRMDLSELIGIRDERAGKYTRFSLKNKSMLVPLPIKEAEELESIGETIYPVKEAEELDSIIKTVNPDVKIDRLSKSSKILRRSVSIATVLLILGGMFWCHDAMFRDRRNAVKAVHTYHELYGAWPKDLKQVKEKVKDIRFNWRYRYCTDGQSFSLFYSGGLNDKGTSYSSLTQEWEEHYY